MLRKLQIALLVPLALTVTVLLFLNRSSYSPISQPVQPETKVIETPAPPGRPDPLSDQVRAFATEEGRHEPQRETSRPVNPDDAPTPPHGEKLR